MSRCKIAFMGCQGNDGELASEVILITKLQGWKKLGIQGGHKISELVGTKQNLS